MTADQIALAGLAFMVFSAILGGAYKLGRHAQRLDTHEGDIKDLKTTSDEHSKAISSWDQALKLLEEVRHDVKNLLTGRIVPGRRGRPEAPE